MMRLRPGLRQWVQQGQLSGAGVAPIEYLLRETFSADDATPVTGSRSADVVGNVTFTDTGSKAAIASGEWYANGITGAADPYMGDSGAPYTNHAGLYWFARVRLPDVSGVSGAWASGLFFSATVTQLIPQIGIRTGNNLLYAMVGASNNIDTKRTHAPGEELDFLVVSHGTGGSAWIRGINESRWLRVWIDNLTANTNAYPRVAPITAATKQIYVSEIARGQLSAPHLVVTDTASVNEATTTNGQTATAPDADSRIEHTITAATGVMQDIMVRRTDADNGYIIRCDQTNSTIAIHKREAGTTGAALNSMAQTWTNATQYRVSIATDGNIISTWVDYTAKAHVTTATFNRDATGISVSHAGVNLRAFAVRQTIDGTPPKRTITGGVLLGIGDSKTRGETDSTATYALGANGFMQRITADLNTATGNEWTEITRLATGGIATATMAADIDKRIADTFAYPTHILINLGANDTSTLQADYETALAYIMDAVHTRWSSAAIYVSAPWRDVGGTHWDDMYAWIGNVLATRSWAYRGVVERDTLEAGDNGVTYYADGVHPNAAGHQLYADTMIAIMGY